MNILTRKIRNKGYSLLEFCDGELISLRTYRRWEKEDHDKHLWLIHLTDKLEQRHSGVRISSIEEASIIFGDEH